MYIWYTYLCIHAVFCIIYIWYTFCALPHTIFYIFLYCVSSLTCLDLKTATWLTLLPFWDPHPVWAPSLLLPASLHTGYEFTAAVVLRSIFQNGFAQCLGAVNFLRKLPSVLLSEDFDPGKSIQLPKCFFCMNLWATKSISPLQSTASVEGFPVFPSTIRATHRLPAFGVFCWNLNWLRSMKIACSIILMHG